MSSKMLEIVEVPYPGDSKGAFVIGDPDTQRIRLTFYKSTKPNELNGKAYLGEKTAGPPRHVHGGCQAAVLDEIMGSTGWHHGYKVVARKIDVEFLEMVPTDQTYDILGRILKIDGKKVFIEGELRDSSGKLLARSTGIFVQLSEEILQKLRMKNQKN